jgi:hypothetical protein
MKSTLSYTIIALAFIFMALIALPVSAVSITESPSHLQRGDPVTITIRDLRDGSRFSMQIEGRFSTLPNAVQSFETSNFYFPISLKAGTLSATTHGTNWTELSVKKGGTTVNVIDNADDNGVFTRSQSYDATNGTYTHMILRGQARPDVSQISAELSLAGTKSGPADSEITFNVNGIDDGTVTVTIDVDGQQVLYKTITVGAGVTATPTTATPVPTTTSPTSTLTTGATTTTAVTTTGTATPSVTTTAPTGTVTAEQVKIFYSADNNVALSAQGVDYAALLIVKAENLPGDWMEISKPYTLAPENLAFSPPATISFNIPQDPASGDYAYFIGRYMNNQWVPVPSTSGGTTIQAKIGQAGTYSLMAYKPESSLPVSGTTTSAVTPAVKGTPRIASIATATTTAAPVATTKQSPSALLLLPVALAICCALVLRRE